MIVICDKAQDIVIPAGLGDNAGVVYEKSGVESLNGQQGDLTLKTVNGNELLGEGDVAIDTGVESLNGQKGALTLKTVNGNELTGEGNIEIQAGVESVNGQTGAVKIKSVNGQSLMGDGDVPVDVGVKTLNGQKGDLKIKSVNGADMLGEGNVAIDTGVESLNGQKGALTLKTVNGNELTGDGNIEIKAGSDDVIVLDGLTQEEVKAIYDKLDKTKVPDAVFVYLNSYSFRTYWDGEGNLNFDIFRSSYDAIELNKITVTKTGEIYRGREVCSYTNSCVIQVDSHVNETDPFECSYIGSFLEYLQRVYNKPYAYFIWFKQGYGASTKPVYAPFTVIWDNNNFDGTSPVRIQFIANEKLYTYLHGDTDNKWLFESAKPITGGGNQNVIVLDGLTQEERKAVYDKFDKSKPIDAVFVYSNSTSVRAFWSGENIYFYCFTENENGIKLQGFYFSSDGSVGGQAIAPNYTNSLIIEVNEHINESDNFNCGYTGSFQNYLVEPFTRPNAYFILFKKGYGANTKSVYAPFTAVWDKDFIDNNYTATPVTIQFTIDGITYKYRNDLTNQNTWQYDGKISMYDSHSINGYNGTSLVLGGVALDATDRNKYVAMRSMMGYDTIFNGDNDGSCPYLTITTTDSQMYKVPVVVKCNKQNDSATRATFEFDLNGYHYLYTQDNQGDFTFSFTSKTQIANINSDEVSNIKVLTQSEYDALEPKDPNTMYCIKGQ